MENLFYIAIEAAPVAMLVTSEKGSIVFANKQAETVFGYSREEFESLSIEHLVPPRFRGNHPEYRKEFYRSPSSRGMGVGRELFGLNKSGREFPVEIGLNPFVTEEGTFVLSSVVDITERKRIEKELAEQRSFLRQVIDINPNFVFAKDREGRFILVNKAVADAYGTTVEELLGKSDADFNKNPEEVEHFRKDDLEVIEGNHEKFVAEEVITDSAGRRRWLQTVKRPLRDAHGVISCVLGVATDVSERKRAEERSRNVVQNALDAVVTLDSHGRIVSWNRQAELIFGRTEESVMGRAFPELCIAHSNLSSYEEGMQQPLSSGNAEMVNSRVELIARRGNGEEFPVEVSVSLTRPGEDAEYTAFIRDITMRKRAEDELSEYRRGLERLVDERTKELMASQERARRVERLASMGALAAGIAHEINNPVGAMMIAAQNARNALEEIHSLAEAKKLLSATCEKILNQTRRCGLIVKGVLQFSKSQSADRIACDMNSLVQSSIQLLQDSVNTEHVSIVTRLAEQLPSIEVNPLEMEQVIVNLLKNAAESSASTVQVIVSTRHANGGLELVIEDSGLGMTEESRAHAFDPFFTTHLDSGGTGLGLSIVHGIVTSYGGTIEIESELDRGTRIIVVIPISGQRAELLNRN